MYRRLGFTNYQTAFFQISLLLLVLYWTSFHSYLLFHSLIEVAGATILFLIFIIIWNARRYLDNDYFLVIGIGSLFIGAIAVFHLLTYKGMGVLPDNGSNLATQLWIAERYLAAATFLVAPFVIGKKINIPLTVLLFLTAFFLIILSIFDWNIFPQAYVEGEGLTDFKENSEYIIAFFFILSAILVYLDRKHFDKRANKLIIFSLLTGSAAEVTFTDYANVYGSANMLGHLFLLISFYLLYLGIVEIALRKPSRVLYKNLRDSRIVAYKNNKILTQVVEKKTEELKRSNTDLTYTNKILYSRNKLLTLATSSSNRREYLDEVVTLIRDWSGCNCVGVRVLNEADRIPYESYVGFTLKFWESENWLSIKKDHCACIRVIRGESDPKDKDVTSEQGSFHCNNMQKFSAELSDSEKKRFRGVCVKCGYTSVAVIPIRFHNKIIGAVHLADKSGNKVQGEVVKFIESVISIVGESINKFNLKDSLDKANRALTVLSTTNHILVHSEAEENLLKNICKNIVEKGGYLGAWIGYPEYNSEKSIKVASQYGLGPVRMEEFKLTWDKKDKRPYPARYAIMEGQTQIMKYVRNNPDAGEFIDFSQRAGFKSVISFPLFNKSKVIGALTIFAKEPNAFNRYEVKLLNELAEDLAFGINNLRSRKAKEQSEKQLIESYKHAGLINRKISLLLDLENKVKKKGKKEFAQYVLKTAVNISNSNLGVFYKFDERGTFTLISSVKVGNPTQEEFRKIQAGSFDFLNPLIERQAKMEINSKHHDLGCLNIKGKTKCFLILPIAKRKERRLKGAIFLGFYNERDLSSQELDFYDVFTRYASSALFNAKVL